MEWRLLPYGKDDLVWKLLSSKTVSTADCWILSSPIAEMFELVDTGIKGSLGSVTKSDIDLW